MGVNKTISLDEQTAIIADRLPNFSAFVRSALLKHARMDAKKKPLKHVAPETGRVWGDDRDKCNPRHSKGLCKICWSEE